jgi:hypothetical protein
MEYKVASQFLPSQNHLHIPVKSNGQIFHHGEPIALLLLKEADLPGYEIVAAGQKVEEPSPFVQNLTTAQKYHLETLLEEYKDIFMETEGKISQVNVIDHHINTLPDQYAWQQPYRASWYNEVIIKQEIKKMLVAGIIEPVLPSVNEKAESFCSTSSHHV